MESQPQILNSGKILKTFTHEFNSAMLVGIFFIFIQNLTDL